MIRNQEDIKKVINFWNDLSKRRKGIEGFEWWLAKKEKSALEQIFFKIKFKRYFY